MYGREGDAITRGRGRTELTAERPRLHKVVLANDDSTPREFVVLTLKAEFRPNEAQASRILLTAHQQGTIASLDVVQERRWGFSRAGLGRASGCHGRQADGRSIAQGRERLQAHGAALDGPLVVLLQQQGADQAADG